MIYIICGYIDNIAFNRETEQYISELTKMLNERDITIRSLTSEVDKISREKNHLQKTLHTFRSHITGLEQAKKKLSKNQDRLQMSKKEQENEYNMVVQQNVELIESLKELKKEMIMNSLIAANGAGNSIKKMILEMHFPKQVKYDKISINMLAFFERISFKSRFCFEMMNVFYVENNSMSESIINASFNERILILNNVYEICPILIKHDRFIDSIQIGLISCFKDIFDRAVCIFLYFSKYIIIFRVIYYIFMFNERLVNGVVY